MLQLDKKNFELEASQNNNIGKIFVDNEWKTAGGSKVSSLSPIDGESVWFGNSSNQHDLTDAINSSKKAQPFWKKLPFDEKIKIIEKFCELVKRDTEKLAWAISLEIGKPFWESKTEVGAVPGKLAPSIDAYKKRSCSINFEAKIQGIDSEVSTEFIPHGIVAVIGPYNFPLHMPNGHIMPALIAGNSVIFKPSEFGMLSAHFYMELWKEAGLPKGVINMLIGNGDIGKDIVNHKDINSIFFTGSGKVGKYIENTIRNTNKLCALEMGGDGVVYVHDYDDLTGALKTIIQSSLITSGQRCSTGRQLLISDDAYKNGFLNQLIIAINKITIGNPFDEPQPFYGPIRNIKDVNNIKNFILEAKKQSAEIILKPTYTGHNNLLVSPGVIKLNSDNNWDPGEVIGPIIRVKVVKGIDEAIQIANSVDLRLIAGIITKDKDVFEKFADSVKYGGINWNCSTTGNSGWAVFGGHGDSGNFRPSGLLATDYCVISQSRIRKATSAVKAEMPGLCI